MNFFEKILYFLQGEMNEPFAFGWFHNMWLILAVITIFMLLKKRKNHNDKMLKMILGVYGLTALILEVLKQLIWSFNYDPVIKIVTWDYQWYATPFQLCTTPIFISIICLFLKKGKLRNSLLSFLAYITILGSISTMLLPNDCLVKDILINIHTMWLHVGSFVVSVYLFISKEVEINLKSLRNALIVFIVFLLIALCLNILVYNLGILNGEIFNMFYISPYFTSNLPVFTYLQQNLPYIVFLFIYIITFVIGGLLIYLFAKFIKYIYLLINKNKGN